jgi:predicted protein tyrosine phosphatase
MPKILVTPLAEIEKVIGLDRPSHLLSLLGPDYMIGAHPRFPDGRHLRIEIHDIAFAMDGQREPRRAHVDQVLAFADDWDRTSPMLIHCWAGISRSTASMFMILCKLNPGTDELGILRRMRRLAPHIQPNRLLVALADERLGRDGRMVEALDAAGPADLATMGYRFELPALLDPDRTAQVA